MLISIIMMVLIKYILKFSISNLQILLNVIIISKKISRGIAGEYQDREFLFNIGETSCGKGILTTFLNIAFEAYINTFNGEELIGKSSSSGDTARDFSFIADMYDCRIGISNELDLKVDERKREVKGIICNLMKRLTGGGDKFRVRKLYKDPIEVINKCMPMLMVNDLPQKLESMMLILLELIISRMTVPQKLILMKIMRYILKPMKLLRILSEIIILSIVLFIYYVPNIQIVVMRK